MSATGGHVSRRSPRTRAAALILVLVGLLSMGGPRFASAVPGPPARQLTRAEVVTAGASIAAHVLREPGGSILELTLPPTPSNTVLPGGEQARRVALRVLDTGPDGSIAIADAVGDPAAGLTIAHADRSQARSSLPGVGGAAFDPRGGWLAVTDLSGRLWRVEADSGRASRLGDGRYIGPAAFLPDGSLLLVAGSSVGAPYESRLVRFNPETAGEAPVYAGQGFVFSARPLADGSLAAVIHPFGGGVAVVRIGVDGPRPLAELAPDAIDVSVSADGSRIAYARAGDGIYLAGGAAGPGRRLGSGELPRIAEDGSSILVLRDGASVLLAPDGEERDRFASPTVAWLACPPGCRP